MAFFEAYRGGVLPDGLTLSFPTVEYKIPDLGRDTLTLVVDTHINAASKVGSTYATEFDPITDTTTASDRFNDGILVTAKRTGDLNTRELHAKIKDGTEFALKLDGNSFSHSYTPRGKEPIGWRTGRPPRAVRKQAREVFGIKL